LVRIKSCFFPIWGFAELGQMRRKCRHWGGPRVEKRIFFNIFNMINMPDRYRASPASIDPRPDSGFAIEGK
jgi:hypothetical protein